jgi:hypothetical protein
MKSRQTTIDKYFNFLKYLADLQKTKDHIYDVSDLVKKYHLNSCVFSHMVRLGYAKNVSIRTYKFLLVKPEPIHAKKLLDSINADRIKSRNAEKDIKRKVVKNKKLNSQAANKEIKILWGLITLKF